MGKLNIVVEAAPASTREIKNLELYKEVVEAFNAMEVGKSFVIPNSDLSSTSLEGKIRTLVTLKEGERLKVSRIKDENGKLSAIRISKLTPVVPKSNPAAEEAASQGTAPTA